MTQPLTLQLEDALRQAAGADAAPVSLTIDYAKTGVGAGTGAGAVSARGWIERATRSLVFAQAEARTADGILAGAASGVFRRVNV
ncbi:hypothetical protein SGCZBJ_05515 [Caulobacter zeae]|uniref:Thioesterase domain-containing protein n=1 Tax=Caulobacter zeae TaxID=2055137 RepID=A0A2N5DP18_9CAUL|nr:hypothetical protein [Caulobacter zeae]PLR27811.1 hypothetical protein SGCZBJ_05515 [Caulobacter zeae]